MTLTADLSGKRALITGASSNGFGAQFARVLARAGCDVVVAARRAEPLAALVAEIEALGGYAQAVTMDVSDSANVRAGVEQARRLDILVNNAGIERTAPILDQSEEDFDAVLGTNLKGAWLVATEVARGMRDRGGGGSIINVASITGLRSIAWAAPYGISKAAVIHMTEQMAIEFARHAIRVNALAPGYFATNLNREFLETDAGMALVKRIPMRRLGAMGDLDGVLLLLASDASAFMTGSVIVVDGGHVVNSL
jgi:NAD(P)-dependent dehydrogenase (short-subunit alcohol dehydrogenase family)